jgi:acyl-CoA dehydrogenase
MTAYLAPVKEMEFVLTELADLEGVAALPGFEEATPDLVSAVLEEAGKLAEEVLAPLNWEGDQQGSQLIDGAVKTPDGWKDAYKTFTEAGWSSLAFDPQYGGQGLPWLIATAIQEMLHSSNMSFGLCPMLTQGAVEALTLHGSDALKSRYLPKLISGQWAGTMDLTEPQAGSDLGAVRTKALPRDDHYLISGQKIFITYGDHDLTDNIIHLVLARTPEAPAGVRGISLFIVPKFILDRDGNPGSRNDLRCVSLEHKLGIHASPTAVLAYGDQGGAVGYLVGEENRGLEYMFTMMNLARHAVGMEGVGIAERAYQQAREYARDRIQGQPVGFDKHQRSPIIEHPDVRRMLLTMKAQTEAMRALAYFTASAFDKAHRHPEDRERARQQRLLDLLIPVVKAWCTELGIEIASLGIQIHGGVGYIEETGAAQHLRDARITTIYEGTTGIQANDLMDRKVKRDRGEAVGELLDLMGACDADLAARSHASLSKIRGALAEGIDALASATEWVLTTGPEDPRLPAAASVHYLHLMGTVAGGWQMARAALVAHQRLQAEEGDARFYEAKIATANFYAAQIMPKTRSLLPIITQGSDATFALESEFF